MQEKIREKMCISSAAAVWTISRIKGGTLVPVVQSPRRVSESRNKLSEVDSQNKLCEEDSSKGF
jgi:hypothetical protein